MLCRGVLKTILQTNDTVYSHGGEWGGHEMLSSSQGGRNRK